ncbi:MAG: tetraacyldisaccharide 4'-kinase [Candidatus Melainabacteria bacterium]|nr:tetraacyldisaccharide 4'-kinase [Candidatus Melainabacteria bacterium]
MLKYWTKLQKQFFLIYKNNKKNIFLKPFLIFISLIYFLLYKLRLFSYKINILRVSKLDAVVISIGNITLGGSGKTPLVIEIAKYFISLGYKVAVLSRGYKRQLVSNNSSGIVLVSDGEEIFNNYEISGDEPLLIAKKVPKAIVLVSKDRVKAGRSAIRLGAKILILDDGFQHIKLHRDENILLLNDLVDLKNNSLFPAGTLRELPDSINRATAIIITGSDGEDFKQTNLDKIKKHLKDKPILHMKYNIKQLTGINIKKFLSVKELQGIKFIGICGIANPESFENILKKEGINLVDLITYPDHCNYTIQDIEELIKIARNKNIENIITTEKDAIKLLDLSETVPLTFWSTILEITWDTLNPCEKLFVNKDKWINKI